ncbi:hypothetical protein D1Z97_09805 [Riemerella anatipestifer]|uniref:hypothetical protein n=1 Tax=Riemerella anatipestifer TaxID=34085 RepID=UPI00129E1FC2|nr:hypothetical protein [Riemerella anatipestifer]MRM97592.1 hypothetical protein [Riemerella anatipestifer]MRN01459.1 hypothetical protein [Riemerella anatipestifer]MRN03546.1 hypothetical protein [Riemerella anatipestifer]
MNFYRKLSKNRVFVSLLALLFIFVSCDRDGNGNENEFDFTGEEIFKGIFFQEGNFVDKVQYLSDIRRDAMVLSPEMEKDKQLLINDVIENIKNANPYFFENFKKDIKSTNYIKIENAINYGADELLKGLLKSEKYGNSIREALILTERIDFTTFDFNNKDDLKKVQQYFTDEVEQAILVVAVAVVVAAVVWEAAGLVNVVAAVTFHYKAWATSLEQLNKQKISKEYLVTDISNVFKK